MEGLGPSDIGGAKAARGTGGSSFWGWNSNVEETKDNLASKLGSSQASKAMLEAKLKTANTVKEKAQADQKIATKLQKSVESGNKIFWKKYHHYKAKAVRYLKQLLLVPWLHDQGWACGFNWGFDNFRTLVLNPHRFNFSPETVSPTLLNISDEVINELEQMGVEQFLDVLDWSEFAASPQEVYLPPLLSSSKTPSDIATEGDEAEDLLIFWIFVIV
jgi:hypothetical protein